MSKPECINGPHEEGKVCVLCGNFNGRPLISEYMRDQVIEAVIRSKYRQDSDLPEGL